MDFETITDECMKEHNLESTYTWAVGQTRIIDMGKETKERFVVGGFKDYKNIDEWMHEARKEKSQVYFHNLAFDGKFIVDWLLKNGFVNVGTVMKDSPANTFGTVIDKMNNWYMIEIVFTKGKNGKRMKITDSLKKIPLSVESIGKTYCNSDLLLKGEIDYHLFRGRNHVMTAEERDYLERDCNIVATALCSHLNMGMDRMTISSDAMKKYKESLHEDPKKAQQKFNTFFPQVSQEVEKMAREAYRGGYTYLNPYYIGKRLKGRTYDVNSLYPSVMINCYLPWGQPVTQEEYDNMDPRNRQLYTLSISKITIKQFELKKKRTPIIQIKGQADFFKPREYQKSNWCEHMMSYIPVTLYVTNIDIEDILEHYDVIGMEVQETIYFKARKGMFDKYISHWRHVKENSEGGERQIAKLLQNSLYGKFATKLERVNKFAELDENGKVTYAKEVQGDDANQFYTPVAVFITAYARRITYTAIRDNIDRFIYCDTDSIHITGMDQEGNVDSHDSRYGAWKLECVFDDSKFLRAKTYMEHQWNDKKKVWEWEIKACGLSAEGKKEVTVDNFKLNSVFSRKTLKTVNGGCVIRTGVFRIKDTGHGGMVEFDPDLQSELECDIMGYGYEED